MITSSTEEAPSFDTLCAYVDGALSATDAARISMLAATQPDVARRIEEIRTLDAALASALEPPVEDEGDRRLAARLLDASSAQGTSAALRARGRVLRRAAPVAAAAIAASLALVFLAGPGDEAGDGGAPEHIVLGAVAPDGTLAQALSSAAFGEERAADGVRWRLAGTFLDGGGRVCREVHVYAEERFLELGLACYRDADWRVEFAALAPTGAEPADGALAPASGPGPDALAAYIREIGGGPQFSFDEEQAFLRSGPENFGVRP